MAITNATPSVQLYSVNDKMTEDMDGTLARLSQIGFTCVEAFDFVRRADELKASFDKYGLESPTGHAMLVAESITFGEHTMQAPAWEDVFAAAQTLGMKYVIDPFVLPPEWETLEGVQKTADRLNEAAKKAAEYGIKVGYHNHDQELRPQIDGVPALVKLAELLDPEVVLEVDLFWATAAGVDLVELLNTLGERVIAVHVKDGPIDESIGVVYGNVPTNQLPAGQGDVPLSAALNAAPWVQYAVIEFDGCETDVLDAVEQSYKFLTEN